MFEKVFKLRQNGTNVKTEVMAGITTFMTMAYILAVNPSILADAGMDPTAVLLATAIASFIGTACMAFMANLPFALSAGMGLNAFLAYTVVLGYGYSWQVALLAVFFEGLLFIVLSLTNVREAIFNAIPLNLKRGVSVGIWSPSPASPITSPPPASVPCWHWWVCSSPPCSTSRMSRAPSCWASWPPGASVCSARSPASTFPTMFPTSPCSPPGV